MFTCFLAIWTKLPKSEIFKGNLYINNIYCLLFVNIEYIHRGLFTYLTAQDTLVSQTLSTSDRAITSHDSYPHSNPISDVRISVLLAPSHLYYPPWILKLGGLGSSSTKSNLLNCQNKKLALFLSFLTKTFFFFKFFVFFFVEFLRIFKLLWYYWCFFFNFFYIFFCKRFFFWGRGGFFSFFFFWFKRYTHFLEIV